MNRSAVNRSSWQAGKAAEATPTVTALCGGLGGARLALAARQAGVVDRWRFVTNVADDLTVGSLLVCPDTDAVLYALAGCFDEVRGWGVDGDHFPPALPGEPPWFRLGVRDRWLHERRRQYLREGHCLREATAQLACDLGVPPVVRPVSNHSVRTRLRVRGSWCDFQEWLVRDHAPPVEMIRYAGVQEAQPSAGVLEAIHDADVCVLAPSSPVASLDPILAVPGVKTALEARLGPTVLISPLVIRRPLLSSRDQHRGQARQHLLAAVGLRYTPADVAQRYRDQIDLFVLDAADAADASAIRDLGIGVVVGATVGDGWRPRQEQVTMLHRVAQPSG